VQGNNHSGYSSISADGRYVTFFSYASNLVAGDANGTADIFVRDLQTGATTLVSLSSDGEQSDSISLTALDFRERAVCGVPEASPTIWWQAISIRWGTPTSSYGTCRPERRPLSRPPPPACRAMASATTPSISADGRYVTFYSAASNLVAGDTNGFGDIFVRDLQAGTTTLVSLSSDGEQSDSDSFSLPSISADGRYVTFESKASNLVAGDTNGTWDIFVRDLQTGTTSLIAFSSQGSGVNDSVAGNSSLSADGRYVTFDSGANNLVASDTNAARDIFVRDLQTGTTTLVSSSTAGAPGR